MDYLNFLDNPAAPARFRSSSNSCSSTDHSGPADLCTSADLCSSLYDCCAAFASCAGAYTVQRPAHQGADHRHQKETDFLSFAREGVIQNFDQECDSSPTKPPSHSACAVH